MHDQPARMGLRWRFLRGLSWNLVGTVFNQGSTFVVNIVLARIWGLPLFGEYALVLSTVTAVTAVAQLATGLTATRYVAEYRTTNPARAGRVLALCARVSTVAGIISSAALIVTSPWLSGAFGQPQLAFAVVIAAVSVAPNVMSGFMTGALAGLERYPTIGRVGIVSGLLYGTTAVLGGWFGGLQGALVGVASSAIVQMLLLRRALTAETARQHVVQTSGDFTERRILHTFAIPAALNGLLYLPAVWAINAWLMRRADGYNQVALLAAAGTFRTFALFVPSILNNVGMSLLNNQRGANDEHQYRRVYWTNVVAGGVLVTSASAAMATMGPWLLGLFGRDFAAGYTIMLTLLVAATMETLTHATLHALRTQERVWTIFFGVVLPCYTTILVVAGMRTPTAGALGAAQGYAWGWTLAFALSLVLVGRVGLWRPVTPEAPHP